MKCCPRCREPKPESEFYSDKSKAGGLSYACKDCTKNTVAAAYKLNRRYKIRYALAYSRTPRGKFYMQKARSNERGIEWGFTFETWWAVVGPYFGRRGKGPSDFCMARNGDAGPYAPGNVRMITNLENQSEHIFGRQRAA